MDVYGQDRLISRVKAALGFPAGDIADRPSIFSEQKSAEYRRLLKKVKARTAREMQGLLNSLIEQSKPLNLKVIPKKDISSVRSAIVGLVQEKEPEWSTEKSVVAWKHPLIEELKLAGALAQYNVPVYVTELENVEKDAGSLMNRREQIRNQVIDSFIGVTSADYCLADTATLVMKTRPGQARSVSLVPSIHIAVIELKQIIADLKELYTLLKWDAAEKTQGLTNCMTFITGPSKTADIELFMVHGAHGPRELYLYVITGTTP